MTLNQQQKALLIGTLLGDGNLQSETKGQTWRYRALHKAEHKEYLDHKYEVLKTLCSSPPCFQKIFDERTEKYYERWFFNTQVDDSLRHYGNLFYTLDKKTNLMIKDVPKNIELFLTPRAIAYWYMDDGALKWKNKSNAMRICTESFSEEGVNRLQKALKNRYDIDTNKTKKTNNNVFVGYRIEINEANSTKFRELIQSYLIDCMKYKVSDGNKGHL
jgi:hypothetical protein